LKNIVYSIYVPGFPFCTSNNNKDLTFKASDKVKDLDLKVKDKTNVTVAVWS